MRLSTMTCILCGLVLLQGPVLPKMNAQRSSSPSLHRRSDRNAGEGGGSENGSGSGQVFTLPDDVSGAYHFDHVNDSIEIDFDRNERSGRVGLSGYISQLGDAETDKNTPLTFYFDRSSVDGSEIGFQTRVVHGVWYSFHGTILRGQARTRSEDGYYVLHGDLQEHHPQGGEGKSADETIENRTVNFKSMGQ